MAELEGFLCPLCKQDSRSVHELETHYREAHDESTASKFKKDFRSFFENAFNISPKQTRAQARAEFSRSTSAGEEEPVQEPVTNVSGIDTELWPKQEMGECTESCTRSMSPALATCCIPHFRPCHCAQYPVP